MFPSILCIAGFKGKERWISSYIKKIYKNIYPSEYFVNQPINILPQISGGIIYLSIKFGHEMNLKGLMYLELLD